MVRTSIRLALCVLLLASLQLTGFAQTRNPQLKFTDRTLANGMRVLAAPDRSSPTVAIQVWYHVGSKDDPPNRSGFAHLFEHIMFKSTKNMKSEMMDRLTEDVGGLNNAFTNDDVTVYFEVVPSNYLETLLWAEADRLSGLNVDDANFKSERDVVKEEYRQVVLAPPYGRFEYLLQQKSVLEHPYKRPTIGSIEDLDAASLKDVRVVAVSRQMMPSGVPSIFASISPGASMRVTSTATLNLNFIYATLVSNVAVKCVGSISFRSVTSSTRLTKVFGSRIVLNTTSRGAGTVNWPDTFMRGPSAAANKSA